MRDFRNQNARAPSPRWWKRWSLRWRVTATATLVVALGSVLAAFVLLTGVRDSLLDGLESSAEQRAGDVVAMLSDAGPHPVLPLTGEDSIVQVVDHSGEVVGQAHGVPTGHPLVPWWSAKHVDEHEPSDVVVKTDGWVTYHVIAVPARMGGQPVVVIAGVSREEADETMASLTKGLAAGLPALVALVGLTTWLLTGYTLRSVDRLRRQVTNITATGLDGRVDLPVAHDEVHRLAVTLNEMLDRLAASAGAQQRFIADAAHELRSPLTAIRTQLELQERYPGVPMPAGVLDELLAEVLRLHRLVEDLLALARSDGMRDRVAQAVDLDELVFAEVRRCRMTTASALDSTAVSAGRVLGDGESLRSVVRNLLDNAVRHATSLVEVSLQSRGGTVELAVVDDGPGVPPDERAAIFERFTRLDEARARDRGGAGLGLAIVREVVVRHGGSVQVEAGPLRDGQPSTGARFVVRLPAAPVTPAPRQAPADASRV